MNELYEDEGLRTVHVQKSHKKRSAGTNQVFRIADYIFGDQDIKFFRTEVESDGQLVGKRRNGNLMW